MSMIVAGIMAGVSIIGGVAKNRNANKGDKQQAYLQQLQADMDASKVMTDAYTYGINSYEDLADLTSLKNASASAMGKTNEGQSMVQAEKSNRENTEENIERALADADLDARMLRLGGRAMGSASSSRNRGRNWGTVASTAGILGRLF